MNLVKKIQKICKFLKRKEKKEIFFFFKEKMNLKLIYH